jgi:hypothetical protein
MRSLKVFLLLFLLGSSMVLAKQLAVLPEVMKVNEIFVDDNQLYVIENTTIFIYSLSDFKLVKKFGKPGEGPQEFLNFVYIVVQPDHLLINSLGKVSYYKKDGTFIKELKSSGGMGSNLFYPVKEGFIGGSRIVEDEVGYITVNFFDADLKKGKELFRRKGLIQRSGNIEILKQTFLYQAFDNKVFVTGKEGFVIDAMDCNGNSLFTIHQEYEPRKFTDADEKAVKEALKAQFRDRYEQAKHRLVFPQFFPEIQRFLVRDNRIYVATWKREGDRLEFYIFDMEGKLLNRLFIPFAFSGPILPFPLDIKDGKAYQAIENEDEAWELHVNEIK